jgi:hypothetical protein
MFSEAEARKTARVPKKESTAKKRGPMSSHLPRRPATESAPRVSETALNCKQLEVNMSRQPEEAYRRSFESAVREIELRKLMKERCRRASVSQNEPRYSRLISIDMRNVELPEQVTKLSICSEVVSEVSKELAGQRLKSSRGRNRIEDITKMNRLIVPSAVYRMRKYYSKKKRAECQDSNLCLSIRRAC